MELPLVTNTQRFCLHDGDGVRTTVFFKGCPLRCRWCHNPEGQRFGPELMFFEERCAGCGACASVCPNGAVSVVNGKAQTDRSLCAGCGACVNACHAEARAAVGQRYAVAELVSFCLRDRVVYETSGGGVTLSGGEVMSQNLAYVCALAAALHKKGVSVNIDTCGHAPWESFEAVLPHADCFLYDIKLINAQNHRLYTGVDNALILENLIRLSHAGARLHIRVPVIGGVNDTEAELMAIAAFLKERVRPHKVSLLPYHLVGSDKYARLGMGEGETFSVPDGPKMQELAQAFQKAGLGEVKIGG